MLIAYFWPLLYILEQQWSLLIWGGNDEKAWVVYFRNDLYHIATKKNSIEFGLKMCVSYLFGKSKFLLNKISLSKVL